MKSFFFFVLVGFAVVLVLVQAFRNNFERQLEQKVESSIAGSTLSAPHIPSSPAVGPPSLSNDYQYFHGPAGQPYIVGPSANPPNY